MPTVFDADVKSLGEIARETRTLAARVRDGSITPPELGGGTFTVSNLGMFGVTRFGAIINPPQVAILAVMPSSSLAIAEHSMCQPGRPAPHGDVPLRLAGLARFHSTKSSGSRLFSLISTRAPARRSSMRLPDSRP